MFPTKLLNTLRMSLPVIKTITVPTHTTHHSPSRAVHTGTNFTIAPLNAVIFPINIRDYEQFMLFSQKWLIWKGGFWPNWAWLTIVKAIACHFVVCN